MSGSVKSGASSEAIEPARSVGGAADHGHGWIRLEREWAAERVG